MATAASGKVVYPPSDLGLEWRERNKLCNLIKISGNANITFWGTRTIQPRPNAKVDGSQVFNLNDLAIRLHDEAERCFKNGNLSLSERVELLDALNHLQILYDNTEELKRNTNILTRIFLWFRANIFISYSPSFKEVISFQLRSMTEKEYKSTFGDTLSDGSWKSNGENRIIVSEQLLRDHVKSISSPSFFKMFKFG